MLHLASETPKSWAERAAERMDEILLDHAHCEKKAASNALGLIYRYQQHPELMLPLSQLAREELRHFEQVLGHLERRGVTFDRQFPSPYGARLHEKVRKGEHRMLDLLLTAALIEARSCERMKLLSEVLDGELGLLYKGLLASEARHTTTFLDLARAFHDDGVLRARHAELAAWEAEVIATNPIEARMHSRL